MNELELIQSLGSISGFALIAWALRPLWSALASRLKKNGQDDRVEELVKFREEVEHNHFNDIAELKTDMRGVRQEVSSLKERLMRLETKVLNGQKYGT